METRRGVPRQTAGWTARCRVEPSIEWVDCHIVDVSRRGAAIELPNSATQSSNISLELRTPDGDAIVLGGQIRNQRVGHYSTVIGVEFNEMTRVERVLLNLVMGQSASAHALA
jgi:hypothetical protein